MYNLIKGVLGRKGYELADITKKINAFWVQGILSDEQKEELLSMAQGNAKAEASVDVIAKLTELEGRVKVVEQALASGGSDSETDEPTEETYAEFVVGKWYYAGDKVSFEGKNYTCIAPSGAVCVWSPTDYPVYWEEV